MEENSGWKDYLRLILNIVIPLGGWLLVIFLGPRLLGFFMPFVVGWIIAMIANPLVRFLEKRVRLVRRHSSIVIVVAALALVIGLIYLIVIKAVQGVRFLLDSLPQWYAAFQGEVQNIADQDLGFLQFLPPQLQQAWRELGVNLGNYISMLVQQAASPTVEAAGTVAKGIPSVLVYTVMVILSSYFFIVERDRFITFIKKYMPEEGLRYCAYLKAQVKTLVCGYFLAQFKIMSVVWVILTIGFFVLGVSYGPVWAGLIALLDFLPVFGTGTALIPWGIFRLLTGDYAFAAGLLLLYVLTQVVRQLVQPKLVGDSMGLNPMMTLLLLFLGFKIRGLAGMILAVPIGLFFLNLYKYGAFDSMIHSFVTLVRKVNQFRRQ